MNKDQFLEALKYMREKSRQRKFTQAVDLTVNFKGMDFKKPESTFTVDVNLPFALDKKTETKSLVFVRDKEFASLLEGKVTKIIFESEIQKIGKKDAEQLAAEYDSLFSEGPVTLTVAKYLGQVLAPKGKMPRPITTDVSQLEKMMARTSAATKVTNKKGKAQPLVHIKIGNEKNSDDELAENALSVFNAVEEKLPNKRQNVKSILLKLTMGLPVKINSSGVVKQND
ncbi:MAG: hypothetical protein Q7K42_06530 [Candidatus Diapherotrites archaeon]|nr:hypothetical protein [Candidatus Diapherotrites archaeon]